MENNKFVYPQEFNNIEEALKETKFDDVLDLTENQVFLTPWQMVFNRFIRNRLAVVGLVILAIMALFCFFAPIFYPYTESEIFYLDSVTGEELNMSQSDRIKNAVLNTYEPPSERHVLGTNNMGQDMMARIMYGGRISLIVGFVVIGIDLIIGITLGGLAGYYGGVVDTLVMRLIDILSSIPFMPLMLIISAFFISLKISPQNKIYFTMIMLALLNWTGIARLVRGNLLSLRESEFMQAATATGIRARNKIFKHLVPNTLPNLIVSATLSLGSIILLESTLSFLGVGVGAPYASWGNMVATVNDNLVMRAYPHIWVAPGICILLTVLAFNFVGDGLRDATDPRMKR